MLNPKSVDFMCNIFSRNFVYVSVFLSPRCAFETSCASELGLVAGKISSQ